MGKLLDTNRRLVAEEKYVVGEHAAQRSAESCHRGAGEAPDGTECKVVWSHLKRSGVAKLVTVHFFDEV
jgi:hypothetical protein